MFYFLHTINLDQLTFFVTITLTLIFPPFFHQVALGKARTVHTSLEICIIGNNGHTSINRHLIAFEVVTKDWNLFIVRPTAFRASIDFHFSVQLGRLFVQLGKFSVQLQCFLIIEGLPVQLGKCSVKLGSFFVQSVHNPCLPDRHKSWHNLLHTFYLPSNSWPCTDSSNGDLHGQQARQDQAAHMRF